MFYGHMYVEMITNWEGQFLKEDTTLGCRKLVKIHSKDRMQRKTDNKVSICTKRNIICYDIFKSLVPV